MTLVNLRGITESGRVFTVPTYVYVVARLGLLGYGIAKALAGDLPDYQPPPAWETAHGSQALGLFLVPHLAMTSEQLVGNIGGQDGVDILRQSR